jgi:hypothetical protein
MSQINCSCSCKCHEPTFSVRKVGGGWRHYQWTRIRKHVRLMGGDVVDRYEMFPLEIEHVGVGGVLLVDVGRRLVVDVSVSNPNWSRVERVVDLVDGR